MESKVGDAIHKPGGRDRTQSAGYHGDIHSPSIVEDVMAAVGEVCTWAGVVGHRQGRVIKPLRPGLTAQQLSTSSPDQLSQVFLAGRWVGEAAL